jgi:RNA polymerase sigma-70 factor (ECF subfamily)
MSENAEVVEDRLLARRAAEGSEIALATLYERYADPLFAFIIHRLQGNRDEAEDVFQETWLAALASLRSFRGENRVFFWLCGIARHKIADHYRPGASAGYVWQAGAGNLDLDESGAGSNPAISGERLAAQLERAPLPDDLVTQMETRALVVQAMALLPGDYRQALFGRYVAGLSVTEIAAELGKSYKATESLLSRARERFREALTLADQEAHDG